MAPKGNPTRTLELLFAILDEAEDQGLADAVRERLEQSGVTRDAVVQVGAKPPRATVGRPRKGDGNSAGGTISRGSNSTDYLAARLERDAPDLAAEVKAGRKKIRDAAREAGFVKDLGS
jgi:hypothetical protein